MEIVSYFRHIKSFVRRDGRMTFAQRAALEKLWPIFGCDLRAGLLDLERVFHRSAPTVLEIGFGSGLSLLELAQIRPDLNFIGIECYQPGIGSLLLGILQRQLQNIRVFYTDAVEVVDQCIPLESLAQIQIFFPDPWPKRRHHKRRLIQPPFVDKMVDRLINTGVLHLATDWQDYADHMLRVLSACPRLQDFSASHDYAERSKYRAILTKFEKRGQANGRRIWDLQYEKKVNIRNSVTVHLDIP